MDRWQLEQLFSRRINRRQLLAGAGAMTGLAIATQFPGRRVIAEPTFSNYPFSLGVASGDPLANSVVLWTRLAPDPLNGGGMPAINVPIRWQVATDPAMKRVVASGTEYALPELAHSVRVIPRGLKPDRWYWYQFRAGDAVSPVGRTRTAPAAGSNLNKLTFASVSCNHYEQGLFTAYKYLAEEELDLVVHLGDYIYEGGSNPNAVRQHNSPEIITLDDYRNRHALYKTDANLQAAHAAFPWIVTWDDHEVENNYANATSQVDTEPDQDPEVFLQRRAAAYQAYYEHMPLRPASMPKGPDMKLYRRLTYGNLAEFNVMDTRQYRTDQPCGDGTRARCAEALAPEATLTGAQQEKWLFQGLDRSSARWNILAQQVVMSQIDRTVGPDQTFNMDAWDGYYAARDRVLKFLQARQPSNPVVLTGDVHTHWAMELKADFDNPDSSIVGSEFVCTSISSGGNGADTNATVEAYLPENPHIKFFNGQRGFIRHQVTPDAWQSDYRVVAAVTVPDAPISTRASFVVENGHPGVRPI
ncbi:alkaline phosphatase [Leptolyngbya sp. FACHB-36]|uniref:alkaline phosphatase D family protein n=1 Tax=Leptolyngbya sp. FACHB-36 TaxID=2692808 RepID=UPI00168100A4|nr:alkaline phosphatase [Leptolyngbya sp. FACHB-36]MBD2019975.1 alkaline phosphatase [Leptolyngbya sp. FACHB-36]